MISVFSYPEAYFDVQKRNRFNRIHLIELQKKLSFEIVYNLEKIQYQAIF